MKHHKIFGLLLIILVISTISFPYNIKAQKEDMFKAKVDDLVLKHHFDGIQYKEANALGSNAIPYLLEMLNDPNIKEFWVNIIVTLGFIENSTALNPLISFLENSYGEVDSYKFRALLGVPFAIGCIASNGDSKAHNYLVDKMHTPENTLVRWSFRGKNINRLLAEKSIIGLAISGQARARKELLSLKDQIEQGFRSAEQTFLLEHVKNGLNLMDRIKVEGRSKIFKPKYKSLQRKK